MMMLINDNIYKEFHWYALGLMEQDADHDYLHQVGGYLADILDKAESDFIKSVLNVVNPKVKHFIILVDIIFYIISIMA